MSEPRDRPRREGLPFQRIALVLSGGGALGAYEVGVLKVLESAGIRPAILAGVSVGAINAVLWIAHGFRTAPLERVWARLTPSAIGMRWLTLLGRMLGAFIMAMAAVQVVLTLTGSPELSPFRLFVPLAPGRGGLSGALLDALAWLLVGVLGLIVTRGARRAEELLTRLTPVADTYDLHRLFGVLLVTGLVVHALTWGLGVPWPHRFSASILLLGSLVWFLNRPGRAGERLRRLILRLAPETGGRGLWGSEARRRLIHRIVSRGDPAALVRPETHLIISACSIESGRMDYFVNWPAPSREFQERIAQAIGEVVPLHRPQQVIEAAVASSALPAVFEPVRIERREYVDGGVFSNQPLHAVLADDADAVLVVLVSPSGGPTKPSRDLHLLELGGRLLEIANWRNLQTELRGLPAGWTRNPGHDGRGGRAPARVCVVEPETPLPGGLYG
ncbi:MAG: patatin-like phospholipase family protein, partial [Candidatus Eiseniibacteriota bacterium]